MFNSPTTIFPAHRGARSPGRAVPLRRRKFRSVRQLNRVARHRDKRRRHLAGTVGAASEAWASAQSRHKDGKVEIKIETELKRRAAPISRVPRPRMAGPDASDPRIANHNKHRRLPMLRPSILATVLLSSAIAPSLAAEGGRSVILVLDA